MSFPDMIQMKFLGVFCVGWKDVFRLDTKGSLVHLSYIRPLCDHIARRRVLTISH